MYVRSSYYACLTYSLILHYIQQEDEEALLNHSKHDNYYYAANKSVIYT